MKPKDPTRPAATKPAGNGHPLFDPPDASKPDTRDISFVQVVRGGVHFPKNFTAAELPDLETVYETFGGGTFEFIGRDEKNSRITARQSRRIEGKPKPYGNEPDPTHPAPTSAPSSSDDKWFNLATSVILPFGLKLFADRDAEQRRREEREAEERRASNERQTQMMLAFAQTSQQSTASMMAQFTALTTGVIQQHQNSAAAGAVDAKTYLEIYKKGGEEMKSAIEKVAKEGDGGKSVEALIGGAQVFFAKEAEQAATERAKIDLERAKLEAALRGQLPYGMPPQGVPMQMPPGAFPGMLGQPGQQPQAVPVAVPVAVPIHQQPQPPPQPPPGQPQGPTS